MTSTLTSALLVGGVKCSLMYVVWTVMHSLLCMVCVCVPCRYNSLDQLLCVVCGQQIKSDILWTSHLKSRRHKDTVASLKAGKSSASSQPQPHPPPSSSSLSSSHKDSRTVEVENKLSSSSHFPVVTRKRDFPEDFGEVRSPLIIHVRARIVTLLLNFKLFATERRCGHCNRQDMQC